MECPICDKEIEDYQRYNGSHGIEEEHFACKDNNHFYKYSFAYGEYFEQVNNYKFYYSYNNVKDFIPKVDEAIKLAKSRYRKASDGTYGYNDKKLRKLLHMHITAKSKRKKKKYWGQYLDMFAFEDSSGINYAKATVFMIENCVVEDGRITRLN